MARRYVPRSVPRKFRPIIWKVFERTGKEERTRCESRCSPRQTKNVRRKRAGPRRTTVSRKDKTIFHVIARTRARNDRSSRKSHPGGYKTVCLPLARSRTPDSLFLAPFPPFLPRVFVQKLINGRLQEVNFSSRLKPRSRQRDVFVEKQKRNRPIKPGL